MADIDEVLDNLAYFIAEGLAPYQPNVPMRFPNPLATAGQIPATLIAYGHPIQNHVMKRLENKLAQVAIYEGDKGGVFPFLNRKPAQVNYTTPGSTGVPASGTEYIEVAREKKQAIIEVWSYSEESRKAICKLVRILLTDAYRLRNGDSTITLFKYQVNKTVDMEQVDSVYVRRFMYESDFTEVVEVDATQVITIETNVVVGAPARQKLQVGQL